MSIKFPHLHVSIDLSGPDGNVFAVAGIVRRALRAAGEKQAATEFFGEVTSQKSYADVLALVRRTVDADLIGGEDEDEGTL